jgi:predicted esterase
MSLSRIDASLAFGFALCLAALGLAEPSLADTAGAVTTLQVTPSKLDPGVKAFDDPDIIMIPASSKADAPLVLFLTGTGGKPSYSLPFQTVVANQGYRVIALEYDDEPAVSQVCPEDPDQACSGDFRQMRIYGDGPSKRVSNPLAETVDARLSHLLAALDKARPNEGWSGYLKDGHPDWSRLVVSGMSQGAGMAAYIAKQHETARVVLFSSPWDWVGRQRTPAPWLAGASATSMDRWYAEYNTREATAAELKNAYAALQIPPDHIRVFKRDIPDRYARMASSNPNPYHVMTIRDEGYADDWRAMFGQPN